jgi:hypothetical protein
MRSRQALSTTIAQISHTFREANVYRDRHVKMASSVPGPLLAVGTAQEEAAILGSDGHDVNAAPQQRKCPPKRPRLSSPLTISPENASLIAEFPKDNRQYAQPGSKTITPAQIHDLMTANTMNALDELDILLGISPNADYSMAVDLDSSEWPDVNCHLPSNSTGPCIQLELEAIIRRKKAEAETGGTAPSICSEAFGTCAEWHSESNKLPRTDNDTQSIGSQTMFSWEA